MLGIPREVTAHGLNIRPGSKPVKQRICCFDKEKCRAISEETVKPRMVSQSCSCTKEERERKDMC
jgi:hypothetical protein